MTDPGPDHRVLVMPAYNECDGIEGVLRSVQAAETGCEIVVVDDGSRDATAAVARRCGAVVLSHPFNLGYGAALQTGYKYGLQRGASLLVQMDADGQHDPREIAALMAPVLAGELDLVLGSRFLETNEYRMQPVRRLGRLFFSSLARLLGLRVSDPTSGFQVMNRRVLEVYIADFFPNDYPDVDVLLAASRHGLRVGELPVRMRAAGRASTMHGGLRAFYYVYKMLLSIWSTASRRRASPAAAAREEEVREA